MRLHATWRAQKKHAEVFRLDFLSSGALVKFVRERQDQSRLYIWTFDEPGLVDGFPERGEHLIGRQEGM